jgi:hypothetical protein
MMERDREINREDIMRRLLKVFFIDSYRWLGG